MRLRSGVDRPGTCLNNRPWPRCAKGKDPDAKCGKHAVLRRYPFYLAYENSNDVDYVTEKVFHALEARPPTRLARSSRPAAAPHTRLASPPGPPRHLAVRATEPPPSPSPQAGVLPVYFGAPNVADFVPPRSLVSARDFDSVDAVAARPPVESGAHPL